MRYVHKMLVTLAVGVPMAIWSVSLGSIAVTAEPAVQAAPADPYASLPEGPGKSEMVATCTKCHAISNVTSAHKDEDGWSQTITKMVGYGATGSDEEFDAILAYVTKNFGPAEADAGSAPGAVPNPPVTPPSTPPTTPNSPEIK